MTTDIPNYPQHTNKLSWSICRNTKPNASATTSPPPFRSHIGAVGAADDVRIKNSTLSIVPINNLNPHETLPQLTNSKKNKKPFRTTPELTKIKLHGAMHKTYPG